MTPRWFAVLLCLFLAVPLCCCGWHGAQVEESAVACPMCAADESRDLEDDPGCPCASDLVQREAPPKTMLPASPGSVFATLSERLTGVSYQAGLPQQVRHRMDVPVRDTGPPRWYLLHQAWLC